ncbi:MAG: hypothetical protein HC914_16595 [Chloroflexaceae bacterium]|nr:hypothetical protein [Chloroflexaceae bacterium]
MSAAELGRLANYFVANPNLTLETALQALEQGAQLRDRPLAEVQIMGGSLGKTSVSAVDRPEKDNFWADEDAADESGNNADGEFLSVDDDETIENQPANKARVFRIRSLDQLVDETDRMSRAFVDGELQKWAERDEAAPFKVRLVLRQLEKLISGLREIVDKQGWERD